MFHSKARKMLVLLLAIMMLFGTVSSAFAAVTKGNMPTTGTSKSTPTISIPYTPPPSTSPVPIPYPNVAKPASGTSGSNTTYYIFPLK